MRPAVRFTHGQPGELIPGSRYRRAYCRTCGAAIRVRRRDRVFNSDCDGCFNLARNERGRLRGAKR